MKKLIPLIILAVLAFAPNVLAASTSSTSTTAASAACPDDVKQVIQNASLSVTQGGNGTASFTINPACSSVQVSLVSYTHSAPFFTWENAADEVVYDRKTQTLGPGNYSFTVRMPDCYYQLDLVRGDVIEKLGPADSNNFYSRQYRLIAAENGGTKSCTPPAAPTPPVAPTPVAPVVITVVTPTPVAPAPVAPTVITVVTPTPVAPAPVAPTVIDVCLNIEGIQTQTPLNFTRDAAGNCTPPVEDVCTNVEGVQTKTPVGMIQQGDTCATVQVKGKKKVTRPDMCRNIKGRQTQVPKGQVRKYGNCIKIAVKGKKVAKPGNLPYTP